jgi:hypothetical protein
MAEIEKCPAWPFKTKIETARWLAEHSITKLTCHRELTGVDTCDDWIEAHDGKDHRRVVIGYWGGEEITFRPNFPNMLKLRGDVLKRLDEIAAFEKKNARELSEYRRLQKKFTGRDTRGEAP